MTATALQIDLTVELALQQIGQTQSIGRGRMDLTDQPRARGGTEFIEVLKDASDQAISLQGMSLISELLIISNQAIALNINGSSSLVGKIFLFSGAAITGLTVDGNGSTDAQAQVILAGS